MNAQDLRSAQAPLRARYQAAPGEARFTLRASGRICDDLQCRIETGDVRATVGMHAGIGGRGTGACPGDMLLESLVACAGVTLNVVATALGIELRSASITAEGDLDFRGALGLSAEVPIGFERIRVAFELDTDASDDQIAMLMQRTERFCVVQQSLARPAELVVTRRAASEPALVAASTGRGAAD